MFGRGRLSCLAFLIIACGGGSDPGANPPGSRGGNAGEDSSPGGGGAESGGHSSDGGSTPGDAGAGDAGAGDAGAARGGDGGTSGGADGGAEGGTAPEPASGGSDVGGAPTGGTGNVEGGAAGGEPPDAGAGGGGVEVPKPLPGDLAFAETELLEFRLTLSEADWLELEEHGDLEQYVPAAATVTGRVLSAASFAEVGLRHKGAYTLHHCWDENDGVRDYTDECAKLSFKIKFDEYDSKGRLDGLKRINLHAASGEPSKVRELLAYDLFRSFGLDAPRARPAKVYVNGEYHGLFIAVEELDGRYTKAHFPDGADGNLYKEVWPRVEASDDDFVAALETNEEAADVRDMRAFAEAIAGADHDSFSTDMEPWVDMDAVLRYVAVDRAIKNWDGIMAFYSPITPHNFYWYHDNGPSSRFHLIPWDLDNTFWPFDPYMNPGAFLDVPPIPDWNSKPFNCDPRPIWDLANPESISPPRCDPFLNLLAETSWSRFEAFGKELLAGPFKFTLMNAKVARWAAELEPLVLEDETITYSAWLGAIAGFPQLLQQTVTDFEGYLAKGLIEEPPPEGEPSEEWLNAATVDDGLHVPDITNFEFATAPTGAPAAVVWLDASPGSTHAATWNTTNPLFGKADLRVDFSIARTPGPYSEWLQFGLGTTAAQEVDLRTYTKIVLRVASDRPRGFRVRIASPAYDDTYGGIWQELGFDASISATPRVVTIPLSALAYPEWARQEWTASMGWRAPVEDAEAYELLLSRCNGLILQPQPTLDNAFELVDDPEVGHIQVDTVYFE